MTFKLCLELVEERVHFYMVCERMIQNFYTHKLKPKQLNRNSLYPYLPSYL